MVVTKETDSYFVIEKRESELVTQGGQLMLFSRERLGKRFAQRMGIRNFQIKKLNLDVILEENFDCHSVVIDSD